MDTDFAASSYFETPRPGLLGSRPLWIGGMCSALVWGMAALAWRWLAA